MECIIWIVLAIIFAVAEIITVGLTSIWFAGGAILALIAAALGLNVFWQVAVFVVSSVIFLCFTRPWAMKYFKPRLTKTNYEDKIGKNACITENVDNIKNTGTAILDGLEWRARASEEGVTFETGTIVTVEDIRGVTLYVKDRAKMPRLEK